MTELEQPTDRPMVFGKDMPSPKIAFVVDWLEDTYQNTVLAGACEEALERGATVVGILGGVLGASHAHGSLRNKLYGLLSPEHYDAAIVMTGTIANVQGMDVIEKLCPDFARNRVCNVAIEIPGSSSVLIDNTQGMRRMVEHLIRTHHHERIAFIRGPESNPEAEARYAAYRDVLDAHQIPLDESLVVPGNFLRAAGTDAVKTLLDVRGIKVDDIDAIVAADDLMALAALDELSRRGIRVPSEMAIVGFDDIEESRYAMPPLSSVYQPLHEQGREAVRNVLTQLTLELDPAPRILDTACRFRRSCGCTAEDPGFLTERPKVESRISLADSLLRRRQLIMAEISRTGHGAFESPDQEWSDRLFDALVQAVHGHDDAFREEFDRLLQDIVETGGEASTGQALISALRRQLSVCAGDNPSQIRQIEGLLHDARILASDAVGRAQANRRIRTEKISRELSDVSFRMCTANPGESLSELMAAQLPRLGLRTCYVSRYCAGASDQAEMIAKLERGQRRALPEDPIFPARELIVGGVPTGEDAYIVEPLSDTNRQYGFAVMRWGEVDGYMYEAARRLLTAALVRISGS